MPTEGRLQLQLGLAYMLPNLPCAPSARPFLQLAWWLERAERLAFLRRTQEVEAEWRLERKQRPAGSLALELAAALLLSWQAVDLGMSLAG